MINDVCDGIGGCDEKSDEPEKLTRYSNFRQVPGNTTLYYQG